MNERWDSYGDAVGEPKDEREALGRKSWDQQPDLPQWQNESRHHRSACLCSEHVMWSGQGGDPSVVRGDRCWSERTTVD